MTAAERLEASYAEQDKKREAWTAEWMYPDAHPDVARITGNGCRTWDTIVSAVLSTECTGNLIVRLHSRDWAHAIISSSFRVPVVERGGVRVIDMSLLLPQASRRCTGIADDSLPMGCIALDDGDGRALTVATL